MKNNDLVIETLEHYRSKITFDDSQVPKPYQKIKKELTKIMKSNKLVLMDVKDSYNTQTVVVKLEYVHDRWALGKSTCYTVTGTEEVPYTVHYSDLYSKSVKIRMVVEGENPFNGKGDSIG